MMPLPIPQYDAMAMAIEDLMRAEATRPDSSFEKFEVETFVDLYTDAVCYARVTFGLDGKEYTCVKKVDFYDVLAEVPAGAKRIGNGHPGRNEGE
jgi:hypothetical protein